MLVTNIIESDSGVYEVRDSYTLNANNLSIHDIVAVDQNGAYFSSWSTDDLFYTNGSQTVTIFDAANQVMAAPFITLIIVIR